MLEEEEEEEEEEVEEEAVISHDFRQLVTSEEVRRSQKKAVFVN